jgi:hypothetical protein
VAPAERLAIVGGALLACTLLGLGALVLGGIAPTAAALRRRIGLAPAVGLVTAGIVVSTAATVGNVIGPFALGVAAVVIGGLATARVGVGALRPARPSPASALVGAVAVVLGGAIAWRFASAPVSSFDGSFMWAYKIHALLLDGTPAAEALRRQVAPGVHTEYPILYPALQATVARIPGRMDEPLLRVAALAMHAALGLAAFTLVRERAGVLLATAVVGSVATMPFVIGSLGALYVDVVVAWLAALTVAAIARFLEEDDATLLVLAALFGAGAILTKNEGLLGVTAIGVGATAGAWRQGRARRLALVGLAIALAYLPWRVFRVRQGLHDADFDLSQVRAGRIPGTLATIGRRTLLGWPVVVAAAALGALLAWRDGRRRLVRFGVTWALALVAGMTASYLLTILVPGARLSANVDRVALQLVFGLALLAGIALGREGAPRSGDVPSSAARSGC